MVTLWTLIVDLVLDTVHVDQIRVLRSTTHDDGRHILVVTTDSTASAAGSTTEMMSKEMAVFV